jgi:hypothetical protein
MAGHDFSFATDNDPYLQYRRELGSGGFGSVHEVLSRLFNETYEDIRYSWAKGPKMVFMKLTLVIRKKIALYTVKRKGTVAKRGEGN